MFVLREAAARWRAFTVASANRLILIFGVEEEEGLMGAADVMENDVREINLKLFHLFYCPPLQRLHTVANSSAGNWTLERNTRSLFVFVIMRILCFLCCHQTVNHWRTRTSFINRNVCIAALPARKKPSFSFCKISLCKSGRKEKNEKNPEKREENMWAAQSIELWLNHSSLSRRRVALLFNISNFVNENLLF